MKMDIMKTYINVAHCMRCENNADATIYCGRGDKPRHWMHKVELGNPFSVEEHGRGGAIAMYEHKLLSGGLPAHTRRIEAIAARLIERDYATLQLACWCAPRACHCDIIKREILKAAGSQLA